jgi:hypothetical protein
MPFLILRVICQRLKSLVKNRESSIIQLIKIACYGFGNSHVNATHSWHSSSRSILFILELSITQMTFRNQCIEQTSVKRSLFLGIDYQSVSCGRY